MQRILFFITILGIIINSVAQQIPLKGVVTVQNSKTYTGEIQYVKNAEATHPNAKSDVSDNEGKFTLNIIGLKSNTQTQITVTPSGIYSDYVVVNEKELQSITLGRVTPVGIYICKKGELEQRQAEMVGINMRKLEERMETDKKRLQKELEELKLKNDYLNVRYSEIKDSLDIISKSIDKAFERIKEYAQNMVLENLDDKDNNYVKAYDCFSKGELDSVSYYLQEQELELKHQKILQLQEEAKKEEELVAILTVSVKAKKEYSENSLSELIKEWLLLARTYNMKNDYEKTVLYYEKAIYADTLNTDNLFEFAKYLHSIREYTKAEMYYLKCLERYRILEKENPKVYLADMSKTLNSLANLHRMTNEHSKALEEYEEALEIRRNLAAKNTKVYLMDVAQTLNDFAVLHQFLKEYTKALKENEEALEIRRNLAAEDPKIYLDVAQTLNNLGILHYYRKEYSKTLKSYEDALEIRRNLAVENPKTIDKVAMTLVNLAIVHRVTKEYSKALAEYQEALEVYRTLSEENPKAHLTFVARTLDNLANLHEEMNEYQKALEGYKEALEIRRNLAAESPKAYLSDVAMTLNNLAELYQNNKEYPKALKEYEEALDIFIKFAAESPKVYLTDVIRILKNLSRCYLFVKKYAQSEQSVCETLELDSAQTEAKANLAHALLFQNRFSEAEVIYKELSRTIKADNETYTKMLLENFDELEEAGAIPEERQTDVEKIRKMLREQ